MITIVIPSYNHQGYLSDAIESAFAQTVNCEVIVVDDGSTDNSLEIAKKYKPHIKVISQVNKGLPSARNTGIMNATGDYVLFLDADDILLEKCVQRIEETIEKTGADIIGPSLKTFGTSNQEIILMPEPKLEDFRTGNRIGYCCAIKRSKLLEVGGLSPRMIWGYEDLALTCLLLSRGAKIVTIPEVLWLYRTKKESMWTDALKHHKELIDQINKDVPQAQLNF
jgi:glycosyltransferase involved in cell wall biosynthesis